MSLSFLFLGLPILLIRVPSYILFSVLSLLISSFLYHNIANHETILGYYILLFDQLNIINTCCMISFHSMPFSIDFMSMYLIERFIYNQCTTCWFIYFISFLNMMTIPITIFFFINLLIYCNLQDREFTEIERYAWHISQAIYIFLALSNIYRFRFWKYAKNIK